MNTTADHRVPQGDPDDDPRLTEALREYQAALDAGRRPGRKEFLARHAAIAGELADCIDGLDLMRSASARLHAPTPAAPPEGVMGDFRIIRELGRGGMGVVYEAEQMSLGRRVALKVLPLAASFDGRQLQRFENEARAAAHLHHGNIVPVFAVGRERGVPYYAMQLIDGQSLAAVIEGLADAALPGASADTAGLASITRRSGDGRAFFRWAAGIGAQAARALEYAHQNGVIHRDIKPANLLIDQQGKVWVADFGLARFRESPGLTTTGDMLGTVRYMSPEQASGLPVIDPRADVYGLGVTLYELLAGVPAFTGEGRQECLRQILEAEAVPPRALNRAVPAELETVVLKAMAKTPEDRYATAGELAVDLERFLDGRPILARPPGGLQLAARWARRHAGLIAASALVMFAAVVALSVTAWLVSAANARTQEAYGKLQAEEGKTRAAYDALKKASREEAAQHARAEMNLQKAREVLAFLNKLGVEDMAGRPEMQGLRKRLLEKLIDYYQDFIGRHEDEVDTEDLAEAQRQVSDLLVEVGKKADAWAAWERSQRDRPPPKGGPGRQGPPPGIAPLVLLGQEPVVRELGLDAGQKERARALLDFGGRPPSNEEAAAAEAGLLKILNKTQAARLEQIILQSRGPYALNDPKVALTLKLSEWQKGRIREALDRGGPGRPRPGGKGPWGKGPGGKPPGDHKRAEEDALRVLKPEQRAAWAALTGKPFKIEVRPTPWPGRPPAKGTTRFAYYEGDWRRLPDFARLKPAAEGVGRAFDLGPARRGAGYAFRFEGYFRLEHDEECTFALTSDDGSRLSIDGKPVVDNDGTHALQTRQGTVRLSAGVHKVAVAYFQEHSDAGLAVEIRGTRLGRRNLGDLVAATEDEPSGRTTPAPP